MNSEVFHSMMMSELERHVEQKVCWLLEWTRREGPARREVKGWPLAFELAHTQAHTWVPARCARTHNDTGLHTPVYTRMCAHVHTHSSACRVCTIQHDLFEQDPLGFESYRTQ